VCKSWNNKKRFWYYWCTVQTWRSCWLLHVPPGVALISFAWLSIKKICRFLIETENIYFRNKKMCFFLYWCTHRASCPVYCPDQQMHNIYINNILYMVSTATCFDASVSSKNHNDSCNISKVEDDAHWLKHVGVLTIYKILLVFMWRARFGRGFWPVIRQTTEWMNLCCALVGLDNKMSVFISSESLISFKLILICKTIM
jgi:hypothetical protein